MAPVELSTSSKLITCPCQESGKPLSLYRSNDRVALSQKPRKISLRMYKRISFNELTNERWVRGKFSTNEELHNPTPIPRISFKHPFRHPSGYDSFFGSALLSTCLALAGMASSRSVDVHSIYMCANMNSLFIGYVPNWFH